MSCYLLQKHEKLRCSVTLESQYWSPVPTGTHQIYTLWVWFVVSLFSRRDGFANTELTAETCQVKDSTLATGIAEDGKLTRFGQLMQSK